MSWNYGKSIDTAIGGLMAIKMTEVASGMLNKTINQKKKKKTKSKKNKLPRLF